VPSKEREKESGNKNHPMVSAILIRVLFYIVGGHWPRHTIISEYLYLYLWIDLSDWVHGIDEWKGAPKA